MPHGMTKEEELAFIEVGRADIAAGRVVSHEAMKRWVASLGTDNPLPPPHAAGFDAEELS